MRRGFFRGALVALCVVLATASSCGKKQEIIKIGAVLPLSGNAELGNQHLHGLTLALEELNAANPAVRYQLIAEDEGSDPETAAAAFNKLITADKVVAAVTATDAASLAVAPKAEQNFIPLFVNCGHPLIINMFRDVFRNLPSVALEIKTTLSFASQSLRAKSISLLYSDDLYGTMALEAVKNEAVDRGLTLEGQEPFAPGGTDPRASALAVLAEKPDAVLVYGPAEAGLGAIVALRQAGFTGAVCACRVITQGASGSDLAARALAGSYFAATGFETSGNAAFAEKYRARFKAEPTLNVAAAYDAMMIIAKAADIRRIEEISLTNALKRLGDYQGALGPYRYADREWTAPLGILQYREYQTP